MVFTGGTAVALTGLSAWADFSLKDYALEKNDNGLLIGIGAYSAIAVILSKTLGTYGVAYTNNMWNTGTSILETYMAMNRGEKLSNMNLLGVGMIIVGAVFLNMNRP